MKKFGVLLLLSMVVIGAGREARAFLFFGRDSIETLKAKISRLPAKGKLKTKALLHTELGNLLYKKSKWLEASRALEKALSFKPSKSLKRDIFLYLGKVYESSSRPEKAAAAYEQAVRYDRRNWKRHRDLGGIYERLKLYRKAIQSYERAGRFNRKEASLYLSLGRCYRKLGLYKKSAETLKTVSKWSQPGSDTYRELSLVFEGQGRFNEAALNMRKAIGPQSGYDEWARLVYLASFGRNQGLANEGLDFIRSQGPPDESFHFYESLVELIVRNPQQIFGKLAAHPAIRDMLHSYLRADRDR